jgi:hypothetical protein
MAFEASLQRIQAGGAVWWDRWSLPRRVAERREFLDDPVVNKYIRKCIRASRIVWGIPSDKYAEPRTYSRKERQLALTLRKYKKWPPKRTAANKGHE